MIETLPWDTAPRFLYGIAMVSMGVISFAEQDPWGLLSTGPDGKSPSARSLSKKKQLCLGW